MDLKLYFRYLLILLCIAGTSDNLLSQASEIGVGLGRTVYYGDLNSGYYFDKIVHNGGFGFQTFGRFVFKDRYGVKANFLYGRVKGDDGLSNSAWQRMRNLSFFTDIVEFSLRAEYYLFEYNPGLSKRPVVPYLAFGLGVFYYNPKAEYEGTAFALRNLGTEGQGLIGYPDFYGKFAVSFPFGAGVIFKITDEVNLGAEILLRYTSTDYLDDVSTFYVSKNVFVDNNRPLTAILADRTSEYLGMPFDRPTGAQRGGQRSNDFFAGFMVNVSYALSDGRKLTNAAFLRKISNF